MSVTLATIYASVRLDTDLTSSTTVSDVNDMPRFCRDAYRDIMRRKGELRLKADGTLLDATLSTTATSLPDELDFLQDAVEAYVRFRVHGMSGKDERQAALAREAYAQYRDILGDAVPTAGG